MTHLRKQREQPVFCLQIPAASFLQYKCAFPPKETLAHIKDFCQKYNSIIIAFTLQKIETHPVSRLGRNFYLEQVCRGEVGDFVWKIT